MSKEFNEYCGKVMGYEISGCRSGFQAMNNKGKIITFNYNPYDDLNQLAEVVEKLYEEYKNCDYKRCGDSEISQFLLNFLSLSIKQAFRDFVASTMDKANDQA